MGREGGKKKKGKGRRRIDDKWRRVEEMRVREERRTEKEWR